MINLKEVPLFSTLSDVYIEEIKKDIYLKSYNKDTILFYEGEKSEYIHILMEGTVKLYMTSPKGSEIEISRFKAPTLISEFLCFEKRTFPASCKFLSDGTIGVFHIEKLYKHLTKPEFSMEFIRSLTNKVMLLSELVRKETILSSEAKVADLIIRDRNLFGRLKNNEIASILNLTPETFSRILSKFKREKIISFSQHELEILSIENLYIIIDTNSMKSCTSCSTRCKTASKS